MIRQIINEIKERGFSERLYWLNFLITWIFVFMCFLLTIFSGYLMITDLSIVSIGVPSAFSELGVHTGFIVWKSKTENCRKYKDVNSMDYECGDDELP